MAARSAVHSQPLRPLRKQPRIARTDGRAFLQGVVEHGFARQGLPVAAGLAQDEAACGVVPQALAAVQVEVEAPGGHPAPVERD